MAYSLLLATRVHLNVNFVLDVDVMISFSLAKDRNSYSSSITVKDKFCTSTKKLG